MPKINLDIKIGMKEIVAVAVSIPLVYEKLRKLKLKYDKKEQSVDRVIHDESGLLKPGDVLWDSEGDPTDLVKYVKTLREAKEELADHRVAEGWLRKENSNLAIKVSNLEEQLRVLRYDILKVYREIFDCSNGDPEGSDEETMQDILTEYKRCLELKNVAEEKTIKYKERTKRLEQKLIEIQDICER